MSGILADNTGRASGLLKAVTVSQDVVKIVTASASGSATTFSIDNCFDDTTYSYYKVLWTGFAGASGTNAMVVDFRFLDASGSVLTDSTYRSGYRTHYLNNTTNTVNNYNNWNDSAVSLHGDNINQFDDNYKPASGEMIIYKPQNTTWHPEFCWKCTSDDGSGTSQWNNDGVGYYVGTKVAHRGIHFFTNTSDNFYTSSTVTVYGFKT